MSRIPAFEPPPTTLNTVGRTTQVREYELITPLFGGGVETQQADPVTIVRGSEVRGQLRFWWRATRGGQFDGDVKKMKQAEDLLWGSTEHPSLVEVEVNIVNKGKKFDSGESSSITHFRSSYSYVAFPLQGSNNVLLEDVRFSLSISYPKQREIDLAATLWAWEAFGGLGARTRRGCGALGLIGASQEQLPPSDARLAKEWLVEQMRRLGVDGRWPEQVPHIDPKGGLVVLPRQRKGVDAWKSLFISLKTFRHQRTQPQRLYTDRSTGIRKPRRMPGRNHWPEPDEIRRRTGDRATGQDREGNIHDHTTDVSSIPAFPRAAFGLPIQFEFKSDDRDRGDPKGKNILQSVKSRNGDSTQLYDRHASPLILRPLRCKDGFLGVALYLQGTYPPDELHINVQRGSKTARWRLTTAEAAAIPEYDAQGNLRQPPLLQDENGNVTNDVIEGFLTYLRRQGGA